LLEDEDIKVAPVAASVKSNKIIAWQFHKDHSWIPIDTSKKYIQRDNFKETANKIAGSLNRLSEVNFLGLPQVGKSTYLMQLMKEMSVLEGKMVLFIPNQNFSKQDYNHIFKTEKYKKSIGQNHIIGLDDYELDEGEKILFPNASLCIVPKKLSNPYSSQFITPFNSNETETLLNQITQIELHPIILKALIQYSSGFPLLAQNLLNFFIYHKNLSIELILQDKYIVSLLNVIYDNFSSQINEKLLKLWIGLLTVGKTLKGFEQSVNNKIDTSNFALLKQMGFDRVIASPLLLRYFRLKVGAEQSKLFRKEGVKDFVHKKYNNSLGVWTPNNELKFFQNSSSIGDVAKHIFKSEVLINRINWGQSTIDEKTISSAEDKLEFGNEIYFTLGKRNEIKKRSKDYKRLNREFKKLIFLGDSESKKGNFDKAEKYYLATKELKYTKGNKFIPDSNYGKVRLANLYRIQGRIEESEKICYPIIRSTPNPFAYLCLCICKLWKGDFSEAKVLIDKCLEYNPSYLNAYLWKTRILLHIQDFEEASSVLKKTKFKNLGENSSVLYFLLNYGIAKNVTSNSIRSNPNYWHTKLMNFISNQGKRVSKQTMPLILIYLKKLNQKEKEFKELETFYLNNQKISKGINIDMFWWKELI